jgi:hypothetical protein
LQQLSVARWRLCSSDCRWRSLGCSSRASLSAGTKGLPWATSNPSPSVPKTCSSVPGESRKVHRRIGSTSRLRVTVPDWLPRSQPATTTHERRFPRGTTAAGSGADLFPTGIRRLVRQRLRPIPQRKQVCTTAAHNRLFTVASRCVSCTASAGSRSCCDVESKVACRGKRGACRKEPGPRLELLLSLIAGR